jgi:hypothetical protein
MSAILSRLAGRRSVNAYTRACRVGVDSCAASSALLKGHDEYSDMVSSGWRLSVWCLVLVVSLSLMWSIGQGLAQSYKVDTNASSALTKYLRENRLPLVGAQVLTDGAIVTRIVLYGFVATEFGKSDAARKALAYVDQQMRTGTVEPVVENRIEVRPEIARMRSSAAPASSDISHESLDQVLNDIARYGVKMVNGEPE